MNRCVAQLVASLSFTLTERKATLVTESLPPCRGDAVQLTQVCTHRRRTSYNVCYTKLLRGPCQGQKEGREE